jgi:hypothetical protein
VPRPARLLSASGPVLAFSGRTVRYSLASAGRVRLEVLDGRGKLKAVLADGFESAGDHAAVLPRDLPRGAYMLRMASGNETLKTQKFTL